MAFINTIDVLGDIAVIDAFIDRTITEFRDNRTFTIYDTKIDPCTKLAILDIPNAIPAHNSGGSLRTWGTALTYFRAWHESWAEWVQLCNNSTNLRIIDLNVRPNRSVGFGVCTNCSSLIAFVNRCTEGVPGLAGTNFAKTPIGSGTGYIYVPRTLVDSYKAATNWSTYADQFRALEDYTVDGTVTGDLDETKI